jgi:hypothetical protein
MSLIREVTTGWAKRVRLENSLALQAATIVRPAQIKLNVATTLNDISTQLDADPKLKKQFDSIKIVLPSND